MAPTARPKRAAKFDPITAVLMLLFIGFAAYALKTDIAKDIRAKPCDNRTAPASCAR
jgi:hypothetical protein